MKPILVVNMATKQYTILNPTSSDGPACVPETELSLENVLQSCPHEQVCGTYPINRVVRSDAVQQLAIEIGSTRFIASASVWKQYEKKGAVRFLEET